MSRPRRTVKVPAALELCATLAFFIGPLFLPASPAAAPRPGATVTFGLRYDDCSASSPEGLERSILAACARTGVPCTFGVVPAIGAGDNHLPDSAGNLPLPRSRMDLLIEARDAGVLEIALHGYAHRAARKGARSEFAGVPAAIQARLIARGKAELEAFAGPLATFIPPWNAYDANTLAALSADGFTVLSADPAGTADQALGIRFVPATCLIPEVGKAIEAARKAGGGIVVAYFHPYEFLEIDPRRGLFSKASFDSTLAWLASQPDVQTLTLGRIAELPQASPEVYAGYSRWARLTPPFLERSFRPAFRTYPNPGFPALPGPLWVPLAVLSGFLFPALAGAMGVLGIKRLSRPRRAGFGRKTGVVLTHLGIAAGVMAAIWPSYPGTVLGAVLAGAGLGLWGPWGQKYPM
ncbi:MAG: hypothetical protein JWP91_2685 [Fibrobacteres bacterium]|nr:hypothetical protein [Fibrobacterota bacterium]